MTALVCYACLTLSNLHAPGGDTARDIKTAILKSVPAKRAERPWSERATFPPVISRIWMLTVNDAVAEVSQTAVGVGLGSTRRYLIIIRRINDSWKVVD